MTDATAPKRNTSLFAPDARTKARNQAEARFRLYGLISVGIGLAALLVLLSSVLFNGVSSFRQAKLEIPVTLDAAALDKKGARNPDDLAKVTTIGYGRLITDALDKSLAESGIVIDGLTSNDVKNMISKEAAAQVRNRVLANPDLIGQTVVFDVLANGRIDGYLKGRVTLESAERDSNVSVNQLLLADAMHEKGLLTLPFNWDFITAPDASELRPEAAGLGVAILGSAYMMIIVLVLSLPLGVAASI
jgi:phosphate transport system permease protein